MSNFWNSSSDTFAGDSLRSSFLVGVSDDIVQLNVEKTRSAVLRDSRQPWQQFCSKQQLASLGPSYLALG